jgi:hypothetical protein
MIDRAALLSDLQAMVVLLQDDLRAHADATPAIAHRLAYDYRAAVAAGRTAMALTDWREDELTQGAVSWVLACVFVRFCEDNGLVDDALLSGPQARRDAALGRRTLFFEEHPSLSDREYLKWCFEKVSRYPAVAPLFDARHTTLDWLVPSVDGAAALRELWVRLDPTTGVVAHDFTHAGYDTRFLGDLYQELSETAKKRYALLQTPDFVESFILDHTLEPALDEFGLAETRLIDPTSGSGHFVISAFVRLFARWQAAEPATAAPVLAQRALDAVFGVDLNPFATAIARFRLVVAALRACGIQRLADAPAFRLNLATGDSLLHGPERGRLAGMERLRAGIAHVYETEDAPALARILGQPYQVVVGNPPYITPKDPALNDAYRSRYTCCHREYALTVPFMERFFELARPAEGDMRMAGFVGQITGNSFMRREFGAPLVERCLPTYDVTALIDTSGVYLPGHGTPTALLFGRARSPITSTVRVVDGLRGEPSTPDDPRHGVVWLDILRHADWPGTEGTYVRSSDVDRAELSKHPLSIGAGRLLRRRLEKGIQRIKELDADLGYSGQTNLDDVLLRDACSWRRVGVAAEHVIAVAVGDVVRDWAIGTIPIVWFPYKPAEGLLSEEELGPSLNALWPWRTNGWARRTFNKVSYRQDGRTFFEWHQMALRRLRPLMSITWGEVATHNHFVLDRGGKVFKQTAPVIKLPAAATENDHLRLLGVLNSSTACFWLKQVCQPKGGDHVGTEGARLSKSPWEDRYAINASNVENLPLPLSQPLDLAKRLDAVARERTALLGHSLTDDLASHVRDLARRDEELFAEMVGVQEELDWQVLRSFNLVRDDVGPVGDSPPLALGERAFEIVLARHVRDGETETAWFARHDSTAITELPAHWPAEYAARVERRIACIADDPDVGLIERPEHKRRWSGQPPFAQRLDERLRMLVLDRLEVHDLWRDPQLRTVAELADIVRRHGQLADACALIARDPDADVGQVVEGLVLAEAVPFLAAWRYTEAGLRKRASWERTWELQRAEDRGEVLGTIPVPPRYAKSDFRAGASWRLRGRLDVPKERFVLVPGAERGAGGSPVVGWAGWNAGQRARALAARVLELQMQDNAAAERLTPLLAGVLELLPWVRQWQPEPDPATGQPLGDFLEQWLDGTLSGLGSTRDDLKSWGRRGATGGGRGATTA